MKKISSITIIIFLGVYDNQVYVQPSNSLQQQVHDATTRAVITGDPSVMCMPHVRWKPYLATGKSITRIQIRTTGTTNYHPKNYVRFKKKL